MASAATGYLGEPTVLGGHTNEYTNPAHFDDDDFASSALTQKSTTTTTIDLIGEEFIKKEDAAESSRTASSSPASAGLLQPDSSVQQLPLQPSNGVIQTLTRQQQTLTNVLASSYSVSSSTVSLPSLSYTTTTIPTISSGEEGVLYYNLDDLSRYMPENFNFDLGDSLGTTAEGVPAAAVAMEANSGAAELAHHSQHHKGMTMISVPSTAQAFQIQLRTASGSIPSGLQTLTIPTIDTTKLPAGQLSLVQELPEVSRLVFQEVKPDTHLLNSSHSLHHHHDSIVNILQAMKSENSHNTNNEEDEEMMDEGHSLSPLDYTVNSSSNSNHHNTSLSPLNLASSGGRASAKGVKRVMAAVNEDDDMSSSIIDPTGKRMRNLVLLQDEHGQHIVHQLVSPNGSGRNCHVNFNGFSHLATIRMSSTSEAASSSDLDFDSIAYLDDQVTSPPLTAAAATAMMMKTEDIGGDGIGSGTATISPKTKSAASSPGRSGSAVGVPYPTKTVAGTVIPSSKTCTWVFENGQVCGKTFSKSYNLVVHTRMHEDIRPFACTLCDQTFRQKAHLQRHETTHGIQSNKNFYRNPASRRKKRGGEAAASNAGKASPATTGAAMNSSLLQIANGDTSAVTYQPRKIVGGQNSDGEEFLEDEEDDLYVPNNSSNSETGGGTIKRPAATRKYSDTEARGEDMEPDSDCLSSDQFARNRGWTLGPERTEEEGRQYGHSQQEQQHAMLTSDIDQRANNPLNLVARQHGSGGDDEEDDGTSTVASILNTVNSVPTLEQKLESSYHELQQQLTGDSSCSRLGKQQPRSSYGRAAATIMDAANSTMVLTAHSNNNNSGSSHNNNTIAVSPLAATLAQHLPGATTTTTMSNNNSVLYTTTNSRLVLEGLTEEEHNNPEIQAELLNALLADDTYPEAIVEEEVYRLNTLPPTWWVSRRHRNTNSHHHLHASSAYDVTYYSPEGFGFRTRSEVQNFLQHDILSREVKQGGLRQPPIPLESIPIIDDDFPLTLVAAAAAVNGQQPQQQQQHHTSLMDANSIAAALIANLKPEPLENLQEAFSDNGKQLIGSGNQLTGSGITASPLSTS